MKTPDTFAQISDLTSQLVWTSAFGKALIRKGILTKQEVVDELIKFQGIDAELNLNISIMVDNINKWKEP